MGYSFGLNYSDQTLAHVPDFKKRVDSTVRYAESVIYVGWRPNDSGYLFFDWLETCPPKLKILVEIWPANIESFRRSQVLKLCCDVRDILDHIPPFARDCLIWQDGPEHLPLAESVTLLTTFKGSGFQSIIISTPDGPCKQDALGGNLHEKHLSTWRQDTYRGLHFDVQSYSAGLIGLWRPGYRFTVR